MYSQEYIYSYPMDQDLPDELTLESWGISRDLGFYYEYFLEQEYFPIKYEMEFNLYV